MHLIRPGSRANHPHNATVFSNRSGRIVGDSYKGMSGLARRSPEVGLCLGICRATFKPVHARSPVNEPYFTAAYHGGRMQDTKIHSQPQPTQKLPSIVNDSPRLDSRMTAFPRFQFPPESISYRPTTPVIPKPLGYSLVSEPYAYTQPDRGESS